MNSGERVSESSLCLVQQLLMISIIHYPSVQTVTHYPARRGVTDLSLCQLWHVSTFTFAYCCANRACASLILTIASLLWICTCLTNQKLLMEYCSVCLSHSDVRTRNKSWYNYYLSIHLSLVVNRFLLYFIRFHWTLLFANCLVIRSFIRIYVRIWTRRIRIQ